MQNKTYIYECFLALILLLATGLSLADDHPWRLAQALQLPNWLSLSGSHRIRYETLDSQFRASTDGGDQVLLMRTMLKVAIQRGVFTAAGEIMDSRAALDDSGTLISTSLVNSAELLQGYLQWQPNNVFGPGSSSNLRIGRITLDIGSRRLVARNRFRNTINAFTGIDWQWQSENGRQLRAFFTLPINRKPNTRKALCKNDTEFDEEHSEVKFWGLHFADKLSWGDQIEFGYFGLNENDSEGRATRNRELSTFNLRLYRRPSTSNFDYQIESVWQFGESRTSALAADVTDLDHFAHFQHAQVGYTFAQPWSPRLILQYDYASGDKNPNDGDNGRFDTLYGARRFDFGPTSIYGPFARSNLNTPGLRLQLKPRAGVTSFIAYRAFWLASSRGIWATTGLRDPNGNTDKFIGQQIEARLRWDIMPKNIRLETAIAHLFAGEFMDDVPNANGQGDSTYFYSQLAFIF